MTVWVALIGILGTLAGSWGAQLIAARREHKKEDTKWRRESDQRFMDKRIDAYGEALNSVQAWFTELALWATQLEFNQPYRPDRENLQKLQERCIMTVSVVSLLGTSQITDSIKDVMRSMAVLYSAIDAANDDLEKSNPGKGYSIDTSTACDKLKQFRNAARAEIFKAAGVKLD